MPTTNLHRTTPTGANYQRKVRTSVIWMFHPLPQLPSPNVILQIRALCWSGHRPTSTTRPDPSWKSIEIVFRTCATPCSFRSFSSLGLSSSNERTSQWSSHLSRSAGHLRCRNLRPSRRNSTRTGIGSRTMLCSLNDHHATSPMSPLSYQSWLQRTRTKRGRRAKSGSHVPPSRQLSKVMKTVRTLITTRSRSRCRSKRLFRRRSCLHRIGTAALIKRAIIVPLGSKWYRNSRISWNRAKTSDGCKGSWIR